MIAKYIHDMYKTGVSLVLRCNKGINMSGSNPDEGMIGRLLSIEYGGMNDEYFKFVIDFGEFEKINTSFAKANYYNSDRIPCETWFDQLTYKQGKHKVEIYVDLEGDYFDLFDVNPILSEYLTVKKKLSYVEWLESELSRIKALNNLLESRIKGSNR